MRLLLKIKKRGFSLLEIILAVAFFSLSSFAIASIIIDSNINTRFNHEKISALFYAKEGIEIVRAIRNSSTDAEAYLGLGLEDGEHGLSKGDDVWVLTTSTPESIDSKYSRVVTITSSSPSSSKRVAVTIFWSLTPERPVSVSMETIFTNWPIVTSATST